MHSTKQFVSLWNKFLHDAKLKTQKKKSVFATTKQRIIDNIREHMYTYFHEQISRTTRNIWKIPLSQGQLEGQLFTYTYNFLSVLNESPLNLGSVAPYINEDILNFLSERSSHPGLPTFARKHETIPVDPRDLSIKLSSLQLLFDIAPFLSKAEKRDNTSSQPLQEQQQFEEFLRKIYKNDDKAFQEALEQHLKTSKKTLHVQTPPNLKKRLCLLHSLTLRSQIMTLYQSIWLLKYADAATSYDVLPLSDGNTQRVFHWQLLSKNPVGFLEQLDSKNMTKKLNKMLIKKLNNQGASRSPLFWSGCTPAECWMDLTYQWHFSNKNWRKQQHTAKVLDWRLVDASLW
ncbi:hypothetical protein RFI_21192 [Reticulomyxa filosa]|uniref:Uncharacterized protein n=1 Tax=Reticulomyxa filosa TaxID=46433 RepID=X6MR72_RETFI|nr:hypothetical protein RFI_21192 [Reticulomyxa filosa]|eukprot:ETO16161.1 hypothetical protein RFI_21192 [Reticulomyxa filosa]